MKILCISDHVDPLIYSNQIKERFQDIGLVLSSGDLELPYYGFIVSSLNKPLLFVFGNHNLKQIGHYRKEYQIPTISSFTKDEFLEKTYGSTYIGGKVNKIQNVIIGGLGGSMRYNKGRNQFTEPQMFIRMLRLVPKMLFYRIFHGRWIDILLTHAPPRGIHDREDRCHQGFKTFKLFMKWFRPVYLVHGHVHLYDLNESRSDTYLETTIVNAYEHTVIEIEENPT